MQTINNEDLVLTSEEIETDVLVIGGGTAGPMAAIKAKQQDPSLRVLLLEKANVDLLA